MQVHVVVGIWEAVLDEIEAFTTPEKAAEFEKALCKEYELPFDAEERKKYYAEGFHKGEIYSYVLTLDEWKPKP